MNPCQTVQHTADHASPAGFAPAVCAPAEGSASPPAQGQPGSGLYASHARRLAVQQQGAAGGAEPLAALAASLFGLSPDS